MSDDRIAKRAKKAAALGISVKELKRRNKAEQSCIEQVAEQRRELMETAALHLAEIEWRGLVLSNDIFKQLRCAMTKAGFCEIGEDGVRALLIITGEAIDVAAIANARLLRDIATGKVDTSRGH
jgi:hypothetical protein